MKNFSSLISEVSEWGWVKTRELLEILIIYRLVQRHKLPFSISTFFLLVRVQYFSILQHLRCIHSFQSQKYWLFYSSLIHTMVAVQARFQKWCIHSWHGTHNGVWRTIYIRIYNRFLLYIYLGNKINIYIYIRNFIYIKFYCKKWHVVHLVFVCGPLI